MTNLVLLDSRTATSRLRIVDGNSKSKSPYPALHIVLSHPVSKENRLAQLATVDQQRELMRYMRGLNEWLERDVHERQSELENVVARVNQLSHDIRGMREQCKTIIHEYYLDGAHLYFSSYSFWV